MTFKSRPFIQRLLLQIRCYFIAFLLATSVKTPSETLSCHLSFDIWSNASWHPVLQLIRSPRPNEGLIWLFLPDRCCCAALAHLSLRLSHWVRGKAPNLWSRAHELNANELGKCFKAATSSAPVWAYCAVGRVSQQSPRSHAKKTSHSRGGREKDHFFLLTIIPYWQGSAQSNRVAPG